MNDADTNPKELFSQVLTKGDLDLMRNEIDSLIAGIYSTKNNQADKGKGLNVRDWVASYFDANIPKTASQREPYLKEISSKLSKFEIVTLEIGFEPLRENMQKIHASLGSSGLIGSGFVLDYIYNPNIIAGCKIAVRGKYVDLTLNGLLNSELEKSRLLFQNANSNTK